jgi:hypothetical protein
LLVDFSGNSAPLQGIRDKVKISAAYAKRPFRTDSRTRNPLSVCYRGAALKPAGGLVEEIAPPFKIIDTRGGQGKRLTNAIKELTLGVDCLDKPWHVVLSETFVDIQGLENCVTAILMARLASLTR